MKFFKTMALCTVLLTTFACKEKVTGTARVSSNFEVAKKPGSSQMMTIAAGDYYVEIKAGKSSAKIELKGERDKFKFKTTLPAKFFKDTIYKNFKLGPEHLGQNMYIIGSSKTSSKDGQSYGKSESCVYDSYTTEVCHPGYYSGGDKVCKTIAADGAYKCTYTAKTWHAGYCEDQTEYIYGTRYIKGYDTSKTTTLTMTLKDSKSKNVGIFYFPNEVNTYFVETDSGYCERY